MLLFSKLHSLLKSSLKKLSWNWKKIVASEYYNFQDVDPATAPVVIWLQGGPGGSSLFGLLEIHGPFQAVYDENGAVKAEVNPYAWTKVANVIYIDNPVGAGFSYSDKLPSTEEEVADNLYEFLLQWFKLFPSYQVRRSLFFSAFFLKKTRHFWRQKVKKRYFWQFKQWKPVIFGGKKWKTCYFWRQKSGKTVIFGGKKLKNPLFLKLKLWKTFFSCG